MYNLPKHARDLLRVFVEEPYPLKIKDMMNLTNNSRRMVYYDLEIICDFMMESNLGELSNEAGAFQLNDLQCEKIQGLLKTQFVFDDKDIRIAYIICSIMWSDHPLHIQDFMERMDVSRNTIIRNIQDVRNILVEYQVKLENSKKRGFYIEGDNFRKRTIYIFYIHKLIVNGNHKCFDFIDGRQLEEYNSRLREMFLEIDIIREETEIILTTCLLLCMKYSPTSYRFKIADMNYLCNSPILGYVDKYFSDFPYHERIDLTIHILGYTGNRDLPDDITEENLNLLNTSTQFVQLFETMSCVTFTNEEELINSIYIHIKLSYYNYLHLIPTINPLSAKIKENYSEIYKITKSCYLQMKEKFPYPFFESEIAYLTMHFGTFIRNEEPVKSCVNIILISQNIHSTSTLLLKNEIVNSFSNICVIDILNPGINASQIPEGIDFIITDTAYDSDIPVIRVHSILTKEDYDNIEAAITLTNINDHTETNQMKVLLGIVQKNVDSSVYRKIISDMNLYLSTKESAIPHHAEHDSLVSALHMYGVFVNTGTDIKWQDAIRDTSMPLLEKNIITRNYIDVMIGLIEQYGSYIIISDDIAIAHALPSDGVNRLAITLRVYTNGIRIGNRYMKLLFVLSPIDHTSHLRILKDIISLNEDKDAILEIEKEQNPEKILSIIEHAIN